MDVVLLILALLATLGIYLGRTRGHRLILLPIATALVLLASTCAFGLQLGMSPTTVQHVRWAFTVLAGLGMGADVLLRRRVAD